MKPIYAIFILFALLSAVACKKESSEAYIPQGTIPLKMNVEKSALQSVPGTQVANPINQLTYVVFNVEGYGQEVARHTQTADDPNFGTYTFQLPPNRYRTIIVGSKAPFTVTGPSALIFTLLQFNQDGPIPQYKTDDTFVGVKEFSVAGATTASYELTRIVGKIDFKITSPTPYTVKVKNEAVQYYLYDGKASSSIEEPYVKVIENPSATNEILILRTDQALELEITAEGVTRELMVDVRKNKRTIIRGTLNSLNAHIALNVVLDDEWSDESTHIEF